jgi:hypothetical protein
VAATHGRGEVLAQLLEWAPQAVDSPDDAGATPLRLAAEFAHPQLVLVLARRGARVRSAGAAEGAGGAGGAGAAGAAGANWVRPRRGPGDTPLSAAAASGDAATCATLLALGARGTRRGPMAAAATVAARRRRVAADAAAALRHATEEGARVAARRAAAADGPDASPALDAARVATHAARTAAYAARAAAAATRADAAAATVTLLRTAALGVPLLWSFTAHAAFLPPFRAAVADALRALHASPLRDLPLPLRDRILHDVFTAAAVTTVWHCIDEPTWALVTAADALRASRGDPPAQARSLRTRASSTDMPLATDASTAADAAAAAAVGDGDGDGSSSSDADPLEGFTDDEEEDEAPAPLLLPPLAPPLAPWPLAFVPGFQAPNLWEGGDGEAQAPGVEEAAPAAAAEDHLMAEE